MKRKCLIACLLVFTLWAGTQEVFSQSGGGSGVPPAVPGALGYGRYATGGRGGTVYRINTLSDNTDPPVAVGDGSYRSSLRRALVTESGPRTIIFEVGGYITLATPLRITKGNVTIFGETAPGNGITIRGNMFHVAASNVIIRHLRFRYGNFEKVANDNVFMVSPMGAATANIDNIFIQNCSFSWSYDTIWQTQYSDDGKYTAGAITVQDSIIGGAGNTSKGAHSMGKPRGLSFVRTLFTQCADRFPLTNNGGEVKLVNCVTYDAKYTHSYLGDYEGAAPFKFAKLNCLDIYGPNLTSYGSLRTAAVYSTAMPAGSQWHISGSQSWDQGVGTGRKVYGNNLVYNTSGVAMSASDPTSPCETGTMTNFVQIYNWIVEHAGAYAGLGQGRDSYDAALIGDLKAGTTRALIPYNSVAEVGGWPVLASPKVSHVLPANYRSVAPSGYTVLEEWAHALAGQSAPSTPVAPAPPANLRIKE